MLPSIELRPGYRIPRLIRGTWQLHEAARTLDRNAALAELTATFDLGFSAIETADTYDGVEELLGAFVPICAMHAAPPPPMPCVSTRA